MLFGLSKITDTWDLKIPVVNVKDKALEPGLVSYSTSPQSVVYMNGKLFINKALLTTELKNENNFPGNYVSYCAYRCKVEILKAETRAFNERISMLLPKAALSRFDVNRSLEDEILFRVCCYSDTPEVEIFRWYLECLRFAYFKDATLFQCFINEGDDQRVVSLKLNAIKAW